VHNGLQMIAFADLTTGPGRPGELSTSPAPRLHWSCWVTSKPLQQIQLMFDTQQFEHSSLTWWRPTPTTA